MRTADAEVARALGVALAVSVTAAAAKVACGRLFGLMGVEADGYHSLGDGLSSAVALAGLTIARRPPDDGHPYGHRKFEALAAAGIGVSLLVVAAHLLGEALNRGVSKQGAPGLALPVAVTMALSLLASFALSVYEERVGRRCGSALLRSDARHARSDCYVSAGVLVAALGAELGFVWLDRAAGFVVALLVARSGLEVLKDNLRYLADAALIDAQGVARAAGAVPAVLGARAIRSRGAPGAVYVDLRVLVPPHLSVVETSRVCREVARAIEQQIDSVVDVTVVAEPMEEHHAQTIAPSLL
jgi:cation diffusion facilitator family transporter